MIEELEKYWQTSSTKLQLLFKVDASASGSANKGTNFVLGRYLVLYVGREEHRIFVSTVSFVDNSANPEVNNNYFENANLIDSSKRAIDVAINNWTEHCQSAANFMDKIHARNK